MKDREILWQMAGIEGDIQRELDAAERFYAKRENI